MRARAESDWGSTQRFYEQSAGEYALQADQAQLEQVWATVDFHLPTRTRLLDLGCGSGRDLRVFEKKGFIMYGLDRSLALLRHARERSTAELVQGDFHHLPFGNQVFDGVISIAALLHASREAAPWILAEVARVLVPSGLLVTSIKAGQGEERASDGRRFVYHTADAWRELLESAGMIVISESSTQLAMPSLSARPWLTTTSRKM